MDASALDLNQFIKKNPDDDEASDLPDFDPVQFQKAQAAADENKAMYGAIGNVLQGFSNTPSAYELMSGKTLQHSNPQQAMANLAAATPDPTEKQMALYKAAAQAQMARKATTDADNSEAVADANADATDPDSDKSKIFRANIKANFPQLAAAMGPSFDTLTASQKDDIWDPLKLKAQNDEKTLLAQSKVADAADKRGTKAATDQDKAYTDLRTKLESFRGNQAAQQAAKDVLSSKKTLGLIANKDPNTLSVQDLHLLAEEMGKIATGGIPTESGTEALMPKSGQLAFSKMISFLANKPTDAEAGEFIKHNMAYLKEMQGVAEGTLNNYRSNIAKGYKNRVKPEDMQEAMNDYGFGPKSAAQQPAGKPKTVVQNGHTYTLNPQTGEYE